VLDPNPTAKNFSGTVTRKRKSHLQNAEVSGAMSSAQETDIDLGTEEKEVLFKPAPAFHSTGTFTLADALAGASAGAAAIKSEVAAEDPQAPSFDEDQILAALNKKQRTANADATSSSAAAAQPEEVAGKDGDGDGDGEVTLTVNGVSMEYADITDELVATMTAEEKEKYEEVKEFMD